MLKFPFVENYSKLINKPISPEELNKITFELSQTLPKGSSFIFRPITKEHIIEQTYEEGEDSIIFDVIIFDPSDYVLSLYLTYDFKTDKIIIKHVSIES